MVAIGVSGHRFLAEVEKLEGGLEDVVRQLQEVFGGERWTVVSALAEGADRLVAHRLLGRRGTRLVAVLPLPREDYEADFETEASREEFRKLLSLAEEMVEVPPRASREDAYEAGGRAVLDRADLLVAVWDGRGAQGRGGTGAVVAGARELGLPLAWVHAGNRKPGTVEPTGLGAEQGSVTWERLPRLRPGGSFSS